MQYLCNPETVRISEIKIIDGGFQIDEMIRDFDSKISLSTKAVSRIESIFDHERMIRICLFDGKIAIKSNEWENWLDLWFLQLR